MVPRSRSARRWPRRWHRWPLNSVLGRAPEALDLCPVRPGRAQRAHPHHLRGGAPSLPGDFEVYATAEVHPPPERGGPHHGGERVVRHQGRRPSGAALPHEHPHAHQPPRGGCEVFARVQAPPAAAHTAGEVPILGVFLAGDALSSESQVKSSQDLLPGVHKAVRETRVVLPG